jgi:hypothetical protein
MEQQLSEAKVSTISGISKGLQTRTEPVETEGHSTVFKLVSVTVEPTHANSKLGIINARLRGIPFQGTATSK